jgi:nucleoside-diphosphate-sugar epimerase
MDVPAGLTTCLNGDTSYHKSKVLAEERVQEFIGKGLEACIVRPTIIYGKNDNGFPCSLVRLVKKRLLPLPWRANRIHLLSVDSFNELVEPLLTQELGKERIFIAADANPVLLAELVDEIHLYYYGRKYPAYLKVPNIFFSAIHILFRIVKNEKWTTRAQLISRDWFYDTARTTSLLGQKQRNTKEEFLKMLPLSEDLLGAKVGNH